MSGYLYNAGTIREVAIGMFVDAAFIDPSIPSAVTRESMYPVTDGAKFDLSPLMQDFVSDNSHNMFPLFKTPHNNAVYGIMISQNNDIIICKDYTYFNGNTYPNAEIYRTQIGGVATPAYIEFGYYYDVRSGRTNDVNIFYVTPNGQRFICEVEVGEYQSQNVLLGHTTSSKKSIYDFSRGGIPSRPYPNSLVGYYALTASLYATAPSEMFDLYDTVDNKRNNFFTVSNVTNFDESIVSADGTTPEPYVPPVPPTPPEDPNDEGDPSGPDGGDGDHTPDYDPVPVPDVPSDGVADAGFITLYKMTFREFDEFASKCFADNIWEAIALKFKNPTDFLVGALLLPFIPHTGISYYPKFGTKTLDTAYPRIDEQFFDVDCGSITIDKYWGSCFDYEPYTKIQIWLPYIGYKDLPVDEFMGNTVSVKYRCDCLTGDCIAFVYIGTVGETGPQVERIIGQYYGNCGVRVPFGSASFDAAIAAGITLIGAAATSGLVAAGAAAVGAESGAGVLLASGQAAGKAVTSTAGRAASIGVVQGMKPNVQHGGAAGASGGYMGVQKPYIIRRIPRQNLPENFMNLKGYPSNIGGKLADFTGLAIVDEIQLNDIPAMEDERSEIIEWLRGGVLL